MPTRDANHPIFPFPPRLPGGSAGPHPLPSSIFGHVCHQAGPVQRVPGPLGGELTAASLSKRAKSSLRSFTSSWALQDEESCVKPTMSAKRMLRGGERGDR